MNCAKPLMTTIRADRKEVPRFLYRVARSMVPSAARHAPYPIPPRISEREGTLLLT